MSLTRPADEFAALIRSARDFIANEVIPHEDLRSAHDVDAVERVSGELRQRAMALGLGSPRLSRAEGGLGLSWEECGAYLEEAGRSYLGPKALQCAAPGQPDIAALDQLANPAQRARYLQPLARGEMQSCFAMTEPAPGVGSDPRMLSTRAETDGNGWVLNGHKWFASNGARAHVAMVVARSDAGPSCFLVDTSTPGFQVVRNVPTMEPFGHGGHAEIRLVNCRVGPEALLGQEGRGLDYAQLRLEGARLFHCMRFIGLASRAMGLAQEYAAQRASHGALLFIEAVKGANANCLVRAAGDPPIERSDQRLVHVDYVIGAGAKEAPHGDWIDEDSQVVVTSVEWNVDDAAKCARSRGARSPAAWTQDVHLVAQIAQGGGQAIGVALHPAFAREVIRHHHGNAKSHDCRSVYGGRMFRVRVRGFVLAPARADTGRLPPWRPLS